MTLLKKLSDLTSDASLARRPLRLIRPGENYSDPSSSVQEVELMMRKFIFSKYSDFSPQIITNDMWENYTDMFGAAMSDEIDLTDPSMTSHSRFNICGIFFVPNTNYDFNDHSQKPPVIRFSKSQDAVTKMFISAPDEIDEIKEMVGYFNEGIITYNEFEIFMKVNNHFDIYIMAEDIIYRPAHYIKNIILYKYDMTNYKED